MQINQMKWFSTGLFFIYAGCLVLLSVCKSIEFGLHHIHALESVLGGDKNMHFLLSATLILLTCLASERVLSLPTIGRIIVIYFVLNLMLLVDEGVQYVLATRHFELLDLAFGSLGLLTGAVGYLSVRLVWPSNASV